MLEKMQDLPPSIVGVRGVGWITKQDYEQVLEPLCEAARREGHRLRFLYQLGPEFQGFTPGGAWEDAWIGLQSLRRFEGCAIVSDVAWIREAVRLTAFLLPCPVRIFGNQEREQAINWLSSLPEGPGISHRIVPESGVIVVEVKEALRAQDFDALSALADAWIEAHGHLPGIVIHAREFPGWENLGSLLRHVRFVRDHHRTIRRIALASDSKLAVLMPRIAEHFVHAEVRHFGYDELERAIGWVKESPAQRLQAF